MVVIFGKEMYMNTYKKVVEQKQEYITFTKQVGYVFVAKIFIVLLGFIRLPVLTKGLGGYLYGIFSLINVTISLIVPFAMLTFGMSIIHFLAAEKEINKIREDFFSAYSVVFISGIIFSILLFIFSNHLASIIFKDVSSCYYIKLASIIILLDSMRDLTLAFFRMRRRIKLYTFYDLSYYISQLGLIVISILFNYKLTGLIIAIIMNGVVFNLIILLIIIKQIGFQLPKFSRVKSYLKWGIPLTPNAAILWIIESSDKFMVSYFMGVAEAGIYSAAYSISKYTLFMLIPLGTVVYPVISKCYSEGKISETKKYLKYSIKYLMMIAIPSAFGLSILAKPILQVLTTPEFVAGSTVVPFIALSGVIYGFYQISINIIYLVKKTKLALILLSTSAVLNIVLNIILIPRMGILGAAVATLIAYGVLFMLTLIVTRRYLKFDMSIPFMLKSVFSSVIMALCIWLINPESIVLVIVSIFVGILVYFGVLLLIKGLSKEERAFFMNFLKDSLRKVRVIR